MDFSALWDFFPKKIASVFWRFQVRKFVFWKTKRPFFCFCNVFNVSFLPNWKKAGWKEFGKNWIFEVLLGFGYAVFNVFFPPQISNDSSKVCNFVPFPFCRIIKKLSFWPILLFLRHHQMGTFNQNYTLFSASNLNPAGWGVQVGLDVHAGTARSRIFFINNV